MIALQDVLRRIHDLPSLPAVVVELLSSMEQDDLDVQALAAKITLDQSLTAKTLRLANSSFYGMQSKVTSMQQAIAVLGFRSIRTLVTACSVTGSFVPGPGIHFDFQKFWRHSVATALTAKALAPRLGSNPETAFTAGLLHDLGTLVLATSFPAQHDAVLAYRRVHDCYLIEAERAVLGIDHAMVGSALAAYWKFPANMQAAVASHHDIAPADAVSLPLLIHVANIMAHALDLSADDDDLVPPLPQHVWRTLALSDATCVAVFRETELAFQEMCQILVGA